MVAVSSGFVTQQDMDRADEAALDIRSCRPVIYRKRLYFGLSNGEQIQDPKGMQSSRLESIWKFAIVNTGAMREMLEKCDETS